MEDNFLIALSHKSEIRLLNFFEASNSLGWSVPVSDKSVAGKIPSAVKIQFKLHDNSHRVTF